jgi:hypothetical protein
MIRWRLRRDVAARLRTLGQALLVLAIGAFVGANFSFVRQALGASSRADFFQAIPLLALIATISGLWLSSRRATFNMEIDLALKLTERLESDYVKKVRAEAAQCLLRNPRSPSGAVDDLLDVFEDFGYLVRRRAISPYTAWQFLWPIVDGYHRATVDYRGANRTTDAEVWQEFDYLFSAVSIEERAARSRQKLGPGPTPSEEQKELEDFLIAEATLEGPPERFTLSSRRRAGKSE